MKYALLFVAACHRPECKAELTDNFIAESEGNCAKLAIGAGATQGDTLLQFKVGVIAISLDLGKSPTPGSFNSGTTELWTASGVQPVAPKGACIYSAGNNVTPTGDFVLELSAIDRTTAHGTLALRLYVLPRVADDGKQTDCGRGTTEELKLRF
jgi:hypothetical protein